MAYESLYRRYRPQRFSDVRGQDDVVRALSNAVRDDKVGHAYLFSGPRGTGKTSTARILAKALNCTALADGEPCGACDSCLAIESGTSYDLLELDAASNNGVDAMRDLIAKAALGSPGRTKVYILDEVHMLSTGASNALLKTLEEPPGHVVFVLATTDPHKVLPTIRSRTQHFELHLLPAAELDELVRWVIGDAGLDVGDDAIEYALSAGGGSARDTLSALDQVVAAGGVLDRGDQVNELVDALAARDTAAALGAVADAVRRGHDPRVVGEALLAKVRDVFLLRMGDPLDHLSVDVRAVITNWAEQLSDRDCTRALEAVGDALRDMRQATDVRIPLEVALVRLTRLDTDTSIDGLVARLDRLERALASGAAPAGVASPTTSATPNAPATPAASSAPASAPAPQSSSSPPSAAAASPATGATRGSGRPLDAARALLAERSGTAPAAEPPTTADPASVASMPPPPMPGSPDAAAPAADSAPSTTPSPTASTSPTPDAPGAPAPPAPHAAGTPTAAEPAPAPAVAAPESPAPAPDSAPPMRESATPPTPTSTPSTPPSPPDPAPSATPPAGGPPSIGELTDAWAQHVLPRLGGLTKAMFTVGTFESIDGGSVVFSVPNSVHREKCEQKRPEVEAALAAHFGRPVPLRLVIEGAAPSSPGGASAPAGASSEPARPAQPEADPFDELGEIGDVHELEDAPADDRDALARLKDAFPGAEIVDP